MKRYLVMFVAVGALLCAQGAFAADAPPSLPEGVKEITTAELKALYDQKQEFVLVNPLSALEFTQSKLPGAVNLPLGHLIDGRVKLPSDKGARLVFYCLGPG